MSNIKSSRQLRAARTLAQMTQAALSAAAGFGPRAAKYWERWGDDLPTTTPATLEAIEGASAPGRSGISRSRRAVGSFQPNSPRRHMLSWHK